ncbi:response regulator transcription factor [Cellulomonas sp. ICMP 17802]|uniref:response regulator transcription factor n=1 Tax=Cellulomonas sp. ICMP 17802 TaxID=3239199 RepID=UPI00351ACC01
MSTVMVVDDEERIRSLVARALMAEGHEVVTASDGHSALDRLARGGVDLVVLDLMMPDGNGFTVLSSLGLRMDLTPVIVLSAVTDVRTRVQALERGAVDVVHKPFSIVELLARARRHLGVGATHGPSRYVTAGGVRVDLDRRRVLVDGKDVSLTQREVTLLVHLMRRPGEVCRREDLLRAVWGLDMDHASNVVEVYVRRLRQKLQPFPPIETVRGVGYSFEAE